MIRGKNLLVEKEVGRRDFLKLSTKVATVLGLSPVFIPKISHAMQAK
jgi:Ni,Fe-hydrogenase I small subunit